MDVSALLPLVLLLVVGYLLLIRPARTRARAAAALQSSLSPGDEVMLASGLFATVVEVTDEVASVEVAPGTVVRVHRGAITQIVVDSAALVDSAELGDDDDADDDVSSDDEASEHRDTRSGENPGVN